MQLWRAAIPIALLTLLFGAVPDVLPAAPPLPQTWKKRRISCQLRAWICSLSTAPPGRTRAASCRGSNGKRSLSEDGGRSGNR